MAIEEADNERRGNSVITESDRATILRKGYFLSFMYVVVAVLLGYLFSFTMDKLHYVPLDGTINFLQIGSGLIFLWATFSLGGWPIQSYSGDTLTEMVNLWVFRGAYLLGTILIVVSLTW